MQWNRKTIRNPSHIPVLFDCTVEEARALDTDEPPQHDGDQTFTKPNDLYLPWNHALRRLCVNRHGAGSVNITFLDGSARRVPLKRLWALKWHTRFDTQGPWTENAFPSPEWPQWMRGFKDY